ncbi:MAG: undecaprenyl/decaprenyl-phosphate alpha-N-acetylglucosaminyl 1-phosphate transferase [Nitrospinae bacterium]|nr:undecaprenyl/decaprenyl-phosphate alpha-N-acetylglucosaminyl 1-phosphate transferase [Nitrospinota bacterium]
MKFGTFSISGEIYLAGYFVALALSFGLTLTLIKTIKSVNFLTFLLNRFPISTGKNVSPFGGIPVILSFLITLWLMLFLGMVDARNVNLFTALTLGVGLMFLLGIYDDITNCPPRLKLFVQIVIAGFLYFSGFQIERIGNLIDLGPFSILLTVLWIVGITNAINLIDGMDGLAPGIIFFSCLTLVFVYLERNIFGASFLAVVLAGSTLGFFFFNLPPAKIILGDTGSLPLGLLVSLITLLPLNQGHTDEIYYLIPVITLLIPIMDTTFAFFRRVFKGINPFTKDANHFHHRLENLGLSPGKAISILFAIGFYFDLTAMVPVYRINLIPNFIPIYFVFIIVNVAILIFILQKIEKKQNHE